MSGKILQINFKFNVPQDQYEEAALPLAEPIAAVPGLVWKVWLLNEEDCASGGIYLFRDAPALEAYLNSEIVAGIASHPAFSDFSVKQFDIMAEPSAVTRAPVGKTVTA